MLRPKSAGGGRSFLDELLGNDLDDSTDKSTEISALRQQQQRKSVRFFDQNETDSNATTRDRPHSSTLDLLLNPDRGNRLTDVTSSAINQRPRSLDQTEKGQNSQQSKSTASMNRASSAVIVPPTLVAPSSVSSEPANWITAGLRARQQRPKSPIAQLIDSESKSKPAFLQTNSTNLTKAAPIMLNEKRTESWQPKVLEDISAREATTEKTAAVTPKISKSGLSSSAIPAEKMFTNENSSSRPQNQRALTSDQAATSVMDLSDSVSKSTDAAEVTKKSVLPRNPQETLDSDVHGEQLMSADSQSQSNSALYLQSKLRVITMEKTFLEQTVEQMRENHREEVKSMVSLYEQQMRMTSEMYKRHEEMIQEERDRRIGELKSQLDHSEKEMAEMRIKFQQRLAAVEDEWKADIQRIRDSSATSVQKLDAEHREEVRRLEERLRSNDEDAIRSTTDIVERQGKSVSELLAKWEKSAFQIEKLQRSVIVRQEDLIRQRAIESEDIADRKFADIEQQWKSFVTDLQQQKEQLEEVIREERERNESQQQQESDEERARLREEREQLEAMRTDFVREVNEWRQQESEQAEARRQERDKLRQDVLLFEERRSLLETLYAERNRHMDEEKTRLSKWNDDLAMKWKEFDVEKVSLNKMLLSLHIEQQQEANKKNLFEREKEQLSQMAITLSKRAEELEKLSEVALKEKMDGMQVLDEMDSIQSEIQRKMAHVEESNTQFRQREKRLELERAHLEQQWCMLRELKESIVCNLCGSALNRANYSANTSNLFAVLAGSQGSNFATTTRLDSTSQSMFYNLFNGNSALEKSTQQPSNDFSRISGDHEQKLLFWQMIAQQDAASLDEETKFVKVLQAKTK